MKIGIDLTWVKPGKSGGVESYIRNLLDGFLELDDNNNYILFTAKDNDETFNKYLYDDRVKKILCNTNANDVKGHLLWQNFKFYKILKKYNILFCFFPVYEMPINKNKKIKNVTTIHDVQALYYPEYFSKLENIWFKLAWSQTLKNSNATVAISENTKNDLESNFKKYNKIVRIYNPIVLNDKEKTSFDEIENEYKIDKENYYYTVSSLLKHKNLITLINVMEKIVYENINVPKKLVISGVGGSQKTALIETITQKGLNNNIILTKFVSNEERNCLIRNSNAFLFASLFEGFGMPPIEAMMLGSRVITTKCTSLLEVTRNESVYVDNPIDINDWINRIIEIQKMEKRTIEFKEYDKKNIARQYLNLFYDISE